MPRCSFVIPTKDRPVFVMAVLESLRSSGAEEVILLDSSEGDETRQIALDSGVVTEYVYCPELKQVPATNEGIKRSKGEYVRVFSDDDILVPEGHLKALDAFDRNPDIDMLVAGGVKFHTNGKHGWTICLPDNAGYGQTIDSIFHYGSFGGGQIVRRSVFEKIGMFRPLGVCDQDFAMRMVVAGLKVRFVRTLSYWHPVYEHSGMRARRDVVQAEFNDLRGVYKPFDPVMRPFLYPPVWDGAVV